MMCFVIIDNMLKALKHTHTHLSHISRLIEMSSRLIQTIVDLTKVYSRLVFVLKDPNSLFVTVSRLNSLYSRLISIVVDLYPPSSRLIDGLVDL